MVGKLLETIPRNGIYVHLEKHGLIRDSSHDVARGKSCSTNLIDFSEEITGWNEEVRAECVGRLDFSKAFDKVSQSCLLQQAKACGIQVSYLI